MSTLSDPLDPEYAAAASNPPVSGGVEAGGTKWVCARDPFRKERMNGYREVGSRDQFIVPPALGDQSGVLGTLHLAMAAHEGLAK